MRIGDATVRTVVMATLLASLDGCYSIRHRNDNSDATASIDQPAPKAKKAKKATATKENLPTGLAGDKAHHAYTDTPN